MLTLGDLLDNSALGLELLTGGPEALARPIMGAHSSEMTHPTEFTPADWVLLTLGLRLRREPEVQRELVRELDTNGICALGFGVDVAFVQPPKALLEEAAARGFPVFRIPYDTPYREILGFVTRSLLSDDFSILQQSFSMQNYLLDSLRAPDPVRDLGDRLAHLLQGDVYLFGPDGALQIGPPGEQAAEVWQRVLRRGHGDTDADEVALSDLVVMPLSDGGGVEQRWLAVQGARRSVPTPIIHSVMRSAERFFELITLQRRAADTEDRMIREELLKMALGSLTTYDERELAGRLHRFGIDLITPARLLVVAAKDPARQIGEHERRAIEEALRAHAIPYLTMKTDGDLVVAVQTSTSELASWARDVNELREVQVVIGAGREISAVRDMTRSFLGARTALRQLAGDLRLVDALGLTPWLVDIAPKEDLAVKVDDVLGELPARGDLMRTLNTYLRYDLNVVATAAELCIHPNTLRYRVGQIEALLGRPLSSVPALVDIYVACLAAQDFDA